MRATILVCASLLLYLSAYTLAENPREPNCKNDLERICTGYNPVCGDDNVTYNTECLLCLVNELSGSKTKIKYNGEC
ncbi:serine protease inhibitor Kazal-type 1-like [Denticeps clupeoides]|uniref:serine protease inhibitor Kazal-type 1-like n=1 Tax=Denticeps clupeoides TaxID=299321 RepID=UPI0010A4FEA2|nr:serine protease inhibitor Kazal-type 1-like [Denticeps clupeoides]